MAEAGDGSTHTPLTPEWTPAPRASHYPWQGDRPAAAPSNDWYEVAYALSIDTKIDDLGWPWIATKFKFSRI